ncbi:TetR/AcrR family transcriptional regulator [Streptomyces sp. SID3343]|uniref:TetR/AcrR family transcriptional regulator n=1 Tax=Streptomyces sp. SID3343 TaxID=2690260 RepID=UPI00136F1661|nr:TetR/AcrR family transcriptional regulator [Streptomyces sp. SID3343]MYW04894.1 TetR family transcriptional regulator [Streptomyces sp. SID3343]
MRPPTQPSPATPTRQRILDAADHLMRTLGLARTTTKEIARAAGCSEAALYKHFTGKEDLFVAVLQERLPPLGPLLAQLTVESGTDATTGEDETTGQGSPTGSDSPAGGGAGTVEARLVAIATQATLFYEQSMPIASSLFADPALLQRHRDALRRIGAGPHLPLEALARYVRLERDHGRIAAHVDPDAAAALLLGACYQRAFLRHFMGIEDGPTIDEFARAAARTLIGGIGVIG